MTHSEFVKALRDAADFFEARPELGVPTTPKQVYGYYGDFGGADNHRYSVDSKEGLAVFAKAVGGKVEKEFDDSFLRLIVDKGNFQIRAVANRNDVCERVLVGSKVEPAHYVPAQEEKFVPEKEVPVYEWRCSSILAHEGEVSDAPASVPSL